MKHFFIMALLAATPLTAMAAPKAPVVVEMYTSKYCPNCPAAEYKMKEVASANDSLLVVFEHVDYWDQGDRKDPDGLASATQRQYDYSNTLNRRPGEVFTPEPILDGKIVASPPLWWNWSSALEKAVAGNDKALLGVAREPNGNVVVKIPAGVSTNDCELWLIGADPLPGTKVLVMRGLGQGRLERENGRSVTVPKALVPAGSRVLALLQKRGPGAVQGFGITN